MHRRIHSLLPFLFLLVVALSRWPGLMPPNFSLVYALLFFAGVFFPGPRAWIAPLAVLLLTDLALALHYHSRGHEVLSPGAFLYLAGNYIGYLALIALGRRFKPTTHYLGLLAGGLTGAVLFYLLTNTASWILNPFRSPEYTRDVAGWLRALTLGTSGFPETWTFFRNTLLSSGLFTLLFTAVHRLTQPVAEPEPEDPEPATVPGREPEPEET